MIVDVGKFFGFPFPTAFLLYENTHPVYISRVGIFVDVRISAYGILRSYS